MEESETIEMGGVHVQNKFVYAEMLNENLIFKHCSAILANSLEFRDMKTTKEQEDCLRKLKEYDEIKEILPKA